MKPTDPPTPPYAQLMTPDGIVWTLRRTDRDGQGRYAPAAVADCPRVVMARGCELRDDYGAVPLMTVRVPTRASDGSRPVIHTLTLIARCPQCNGPRGVPRPQCLYCGAQPGAHEQRPGHEPSWTEVWHNPCGHAEQPDPLAAEARDLGQKLAAGRALVISRTREEVPASW